LKIWIRITIGAVLGAIFGLIIPVILAIPLAIPLILMEILISTLIGVLLGASAEKLKSALQAAYDDFLDWRANRAQLRPEIEERKELQRAGRVAIKEARKTRKATKKIIVEQEKSLRVIDRIVKKVEAEKEQEVQTEIDQFLEEAAELVNLKQNSDPKLLSDVLQKAKTLKRVRFDKQKRQKALQDLQTAIINLQKAP
jgi:hypothetical protein